MRVRVAVRLCDERRQENHPGLRTDPLAERQILRVEFERVDRARTGVAACVHELPARVRVELAKAGQLRLGGHEHLAVESAALGLDLRGERNYVVLLVIDE